MYMLFVVLVVLLLFLLTGLHELVSFAQPLLLSILMGLVLQENRGVLAPLRQSTSAKGRNGGENRGRPG